MRAASAMSRTDPRRTILPWWRRVVGYKLAPRFRDLRALSEWRDEGAGRCQECRLVSEGRRLAAERQTDLRQDARKFDLMDEQRRGGTDRAGVWHLPATRTVGAPQDNGVFCLAGAKQAGRRAVASGGAALTGRGLAGDRHAGQCQRQAGRDPQVSATGPHQGTADHRWAGQVYGMWQ